MFHEEEHNASSTLRTSPLLVRFPPSSLAAMHIRVHVTHIITAGPSCPWSSTLSTMSPKSSCRNCSLEVRETNGLRGAVVVAAMPGCHEQRDAYTSYSMTVYMRGMLHTEHPQRNDAVRPVKKQQYFRVLPKMCVEMTFRTFSSHH